ncbi:hypothetical protein [Halonotius roseus]|uniref:STAS/SEC14 domain-containing protein n=1 Tax=Halonotius roseus TaxID=2511997 RepID=A0A544QNW2_9EURY|nr:hypothetical protein [Halonotius roseus]TQQ80564.1 hypothetical protein EWF95_08760 [Halonotius roseus]
MSTRYFDGDFATVEYHDEINVVIAKMTDYPGENQFRKYMDSIITAVNETGCQNVLADTRDHPPLPESEMRWSAESWGPKAELAGVNQIAALATQHVATKMTLDTVTEQSTADDIERQYFAKFDEAVEWLTNEPS